jgi:hypothetical protein
MCNMKVYKNTYVHGNQNLSIILVKFRDSKKQKHTNPQSKKHTYIPDLCGISYIHLSYSITYSDKKKRLQYLS